MGRMSAGGKARANLRKQARTKLRRQLTKQQQVKRFGKEVRDIMAPYDREVRGYINSLKNDPRSLAAIQRNGGNFTKAQMNRLGRMMQRRNSVRSVIRGITDFQQRTGRPLSTKPMRRRIREMREAGDSGFGRPEQKGRWKEKYGFARKDRAYVRSRGKTPIDSRRYRRITQTDAPNQRTKKNRPPSRKGSWLNRGRSSGGSTQSPSNRPSGLNPPRERGRG